MPVSGLAIGVKSVKNSVTLFCTGKPNRKWKRMDEKKTTVSAGGDKKKGSKRARSSIMPPDSARLSTADVSRDGLEVLGGIFQVTTGLCASADEAEEGLSGEKIKNEKERKEKSGAKKDSKLDKKKKSRQLGSNTTQKVSEDFQPFDDNDDLVIPEVEKKKKKKRKIAKLAAKEIADAKRAKKTPGVLSQNGNRPSMETEGDQSNLGLKDLDCFLSKARSGKNKRLGKKGLSKPEVVKPKKPDLEVVPTECALEEPSSQSSSSNGAAMQTFGLSSARKSPRMHGFWSPSSISGLQDLWKFGRNVQKYPNSGSSIPDSELCPNEESGKPKNAKLWSSRLQDQCSVKVKSAEPGNKSPESSLSTLAVELGDVMKKTEAESLELEKIQIPVIKLHKINDKIVPCFGKKKKI